MTESLMKQQMGVTIAFDPASGQIVRVHFSHAAEGTEEAAKAMTWLKKVAPPDAGILHLASESMEPGKSYRVDVSTGTLVVEEPGKGGLSASSGISFVPLPASSPTR